MTLLLGRNDQVLVFAGAVVGSQGRLRVLQKLLRAIFAVLLTTALINERSILAELPWQGPVRREGFSLHVDQIFDFLLQRSHFLHNPDGLPRKNRLKLDFIVTLIDFSELSPEVLLQPVLVGGNALVFANFVLKRLMVDFSLIRVSRRAARAPAVIIR